MTIDPTGVTDRIITKVNGEVVQDTHADVPVPEPVVVETAPDRPAAAASKAEWVEYAVAMGLTRGVAEAHTREAVIGWVKGTPLPELDRPDDAETKPAWIAAAVARGMDPKSAKAMTKTRLIDWVDG